MADEERKVAFMVQNWCGANVTEVMGSSTGTPVIYYDLMSQNSVV
jgi:hypothetical protein